MKNSARALLLFALSVFMNPASRATEIEDCLHSASASSFPAMVLTLGIDSARMSRADLLIALDEASIYAGSFKSGFPRVTWDDEGQPKGFVVEFRPKKVPDTRAEDAALRAFILKMDRDFRALKSFSFFKCSFPQGAVTGNN